MALSHHLENYLSVAHVEYQVVPHAITATAYDSACAAHVPAVEVVKAVILRDGEQERYTMALLPSCNKLRIDWLPGRHGDMKLASEDDFCRLFPDCAPGAVPGFGQAYQMDLVWDDRLLECDNLYFEAGDHAALVRIDRDDFWGLFSRYPHSVISLGREIYPQRHPDELRGVH